MSHRALATLLAVIVSVSLVPSPAAGQAGRSWTPSRTAWGDPDLQGIWDFRTLTPMERPSEHAGKETLTDEEAAVFIQGLPSSSWDSRDRWDREKAFGFGGDLEHALQPVLVRLWHHRQ